jgi:hypothetical protein
MATVPPIVVRDGESPSHGEVGQVSLDSTRKGTHMLTTDTVLTIHGNRGYRGVPLVSVYHHLFDPELMLRAYGKIYRNAGAMTKGSKDHRNLGKRR